MAVTNKDLRLAGAVTKHREVRFAIAIEIGHGDCDRAGDDSNRGGSLKCAVAIAEENSYVGGAMIDNYEIGIAVVVEIGSGDGAWLQSHGKVNRWPASGEHTHPGLGDRQRNIIRAG